MRITNTDEINLWVVFQHLLGMIFGRKLFPDVTYCCTLISSGLVGLSRVGCLWITSLTFVIYEAASNVMITLNNKFHIPLG